MSLYNSDEPLDPIEAADFDQPFYDRDYVALEAAPEDEVDVELDYHGAYLQTLVDEDAHNEAIIAMEMAFMDGYYRDLDKPFFEHQYHRGLPKNSNCVRSELLQALPRKSASRYSREAGKHRQFYGGIQIHGRNGH